LSLACLVFWWVGCGQVPQPSCFWNIGEQLGNLTSGLSLHQTEYSTSSESKAIKKPRMVRNMTLLAVSTSPHAPPSITVVGSGVGLGVVVLFGGLGAGVTATGALARTMGRAKAETTMPVVRNQASSRQGFDPEESSPRLLAMRVGIGDNR